MNTPWETYDDFVDAMRRQARYDAAVSSHQDKLEQVSTAQANAWLKQNGDVAAKASAQLLNLYQASDEGLDDSELATAAKRYRAALAQLYELYLAEFATLEPGMPQYRQKVMDASMLHNWISYWVTHPFVAQRWPIDA